MLIAVVLVLAATLTGVALGEGGNPRLVISNVDCEVIHAVWNQTTEDVSSLNGYVVSLSPSGDIITTTLTFDKMSGRTAHFVGDSPYNGTDGEYTLVEGAVGDRTIDNLPFTVTLMCGEPTPTATPTPSPSATPTPTPERDKWVMYMPMVRTQPYQPPPTPGRFPSPTPTPSLTPTPPPTSTPEPPAPSYHSCSRFDLELANQTVPVDGTYRMYEAHTGRTLMTWDAPAGANDSGPYIGDSEGFTHFEISRPEIWAGVTFTPAGGEATELRFVNHVEESEYRLSLWDGACHAAEVVHD